MKTALATLLSVVLLGGLADGADAAKHSFKPIEKKSRALIFDPEGVNANAVRKVHLKLRVHRKTVERRIRARRVRRALAASAESLDTSAEDLDSSGERAVGGVAVKVGRPKKSRGGVLVIAEEPPTEEPPDGGAADGGAADGGAADGGAMWVGHVRRSEPAWSLLASLLGLEPLQPRPRLVAQDPRRFLVHR